MPTIEQNQYWLLHGRIANLEAQRLQQQGGPVAPSEKRMSRAEEIDIANRVIDENLKEARERDANRVARVQQDVIANQPHQAGGDDQDEHDVNVLADQEHLNARLAPPASPEDSKTPPDIQKLKSQRSTKQKAFQAEEVVGRPPARTAAGRRRDRQ